MSGAVPGLVDARALYVPVYETWRPRRRVPGSVWADTHFHLSPESAADPGRWTTRPYQREPLDAMTDPAIEQVTVMKSARVGYTKMLGAAIASYMHQDPCPIGIVQPTIDDAKIYSKEEIEPMLRDCQVLAALIPEAKTRESGHTILHKRFRGGLLGLIGANSGRGFRRITRRVMAFDEPDAYPLSAGVEGDPIQLGIRRTETFWNRKIIAGSTPLLSGISRIERLFLAGDQRRYYVPCTQCGRMDYLVFQREAASDDGEPAGHFMHWPKGQPAAAHFICRHCGGVIEHKDKRAIVEAGEWRAHAPFTGHASFHIWTAYSYSPNATWGQIAKEFIDANAAGPEQLKTFVNTVLGETWHERGEAPEWERLYQRRELYELGSCPEGVLFITAGVDVQKTRLVYELVGWGRGKESWSIDYGILEGDTADLSDKGPWPQLNALLARTYPAHTGVPLSIVRLAVDSGFNTQTVYNWARQHPLTRVIAIKGVDSGNLLVNQPTTVDVSPRGKKVPRGYRVWPVAGHIAKSELYGWLKLQPPTDEARADGVCEPPGYCHFPQYGEEYFKQLTAEQLVRRRTRSGFVKLAWEPIPGRENHVLDCRVYARAAAAVVGLDRLAESDWSALERAIGTQPRSVPVARRADPTAPEVRKADGPFVGPTTPPAARHVRKEPWIGRRPGWIVRSK